MFAIIICKLMQFELISSSRPDLLPVQPASEHNIASIIKFTSLETNNNVFMYHYKLSLKLSRTVTISASNVTT